MSDIEDVAEKPEHPTFGGKTIAVVERPKYKSWRKKYRKMRHTFEAVLEENKVNYREEQKLEGIAKRLREELDSILEICLELNQTPALPTNLRYNISRPQRAYIVTSQLEEKVPERDIPRNITPQQADEVLISYTTAVKQGRMPHVDLYIIRARVEALLAAQGTITLAQLEQIVPHPIVRSVDSIPQDLRGDEPLGYLTNDQEDAYLSRVDSRLGDRVTSIPLKKKEDHVDEKPWIELSTREMDRQNELLNPQSQHNWLKVNTKNTAAGGGAGHDGDDNDGFATPEGKTSRGNNGAGSKRNLAKQLGDKQVKDARGGASPDAHAGASEQSPSRHGYDDDDTSFVEDQPPPSSGKKKKVKDEDGAYRSKAKNTGGQSKASKRKRPSGDEIAVAKKAKVEVLE